MKIISKDYFKKTVKQRGLSYRELGEMARCHASMIGQLASGHRTSCTPDLADRIALCLGVPVELLFVPTASAASGRSVSGERIAS